MKRIIQRAYHLWLRIVLESCRFPKRLYRFGWKVAINSFWDGLIPPGKSKRYISTIESYVDRFLEPLIYQYNNRNLSNEQTYHQLDEQIIPIWCCWWQGIEQMPEIVRLCHERLKQVIPKDKAELHVITIDNYQEYVELPDYIVEKFQKKIITMTTMSDILRFNLLEKYGGYWIDATVFYTGNIPMDYFTKDFYCQRMHSDKEKVKREACRGNWCGFSMAGSKHNLVFRYMKDAFNEWWKYYDDIVDYVLIDYLLWTAYRKIPDIRHIIDSVEDNNEDIFELYQVLNQEYTDILIEQLTKRNVMHKLTYKMDLFKKTDLGKRTLYGYLLETYMR
ncbi:polysaccharide biosynthesis protein [Lachnospiraceae bacterium TWA4]|nr:polysaccharide biosynthesis protein [Lachnospiraceae bacterium TWA4]